MRVSHAQTVNCRYAFRLLVAKGIARADPGRQSRGVSSSVEIVHRLSLLLLLLLLAAVALALQDLLSVLVKLELGDDDLGWGEGDGNRLAVGLLADNCITGEHHTFYLKEEIRTAVDVDAVLEAVDRGDLALTSLVGAADDHDLVLRTVST
jgi:hypothetical protein